jgi:hypothetical protein
MASYVLECRGTWYTAGCYRSGGIPVCFDVKLNFIFLETIRRSYVGLACCIGEKPSPKLLGEIHCRQARLVRQALTQITRSLVKFSSIIFLPLLLFLFSSLDLNLNKSKTYSGPGDVIKNPPLSPSLSFSLSLSLSLSLPFLFYLVLVTLTMGPWLICFLFKFFFPGWGVVAHQLLTIISLSLFCRFSHSNIE